MFCVHREDSSIYPSNDRLKLFAYAEQQIDNNNKNKKEERFIFIGLLRDDYSHRHSNGTIESYSIGNVNKSR